MLLCILVSGVLVGQSAVQDCTFAPPQNPAQHRSVMGCVEDNNDTYAVALRIYIIRKSDGTGSVADLNYQADLIEEINAAFSPHNIYFLLHCIDYIDDTFAYNDINTGTEGIQFAAEEGLQDDNFLTLVIHGGRSGGGFAGIGSNLAYAGAGYFNTEFNAWRSPIVHELGHALGLYHTFRGREIGGTLDLVDGSTCCDAGDFICDTPPDPGIFLNPNTTDDCVWPTNTGLTDPDGQPYVGVQLGNYMSYYDDVCSELFFTAGQGNCMRNVLEEGTAHTFTKRPGALFSNGITNVVGIQTFDTDVRVLDGAGVRFDGATVRMPSFRKIQVDQNAIFIGVNSMFTSGETNCGPVDPFWAGIEVSGNPESNGNSNIVSMANSTIELAKNGIHYGTTDGDLPVLPLVFLSEMTFKNNRVALNLASGRFAGSIFNQSWVQACVDCDFVIDTDYPVGSVPFSSAIKLAFNRDFWCVDCDLSLPALDAEFAGFPAIDVLHSQLQFYTSCLTASSGPLDCTGEGVKRSTIRNYPTGIRLTNSDNSSVRDATFENLTHGIRATNSPSLLVQNSVFETNSDGLASGYAILTDECSGFMIDRNHFTSIGSPLPRTHAMFIFNSGEAESFIRNNYFQDFGKGVIEVTGVNSTMSDGGLSGLRILCNDFNNPDEGPSFQQGPFDINVDIAANIARFQGALNNPAGNKFTANIGPSDVNIRNRGNQLIDYVYSDAPNEVRAEPIISNGVATIISAQASQCIDFAQEEDGFVGDYPSVENGYVRTLEVRDEISLESNPGEVRKLEIRLSELNTFLGTQILLLEKEIERDTNSVNSLAALVSLSNLRSGYLARMQTSLIESRYGDWEAHVSYVKTKAIPTDYGVDFEKSILVYRSLLDLLEGAGNAERSFHDFTNEELEQLKKSQQEGTVGIGNAFASSLLGIYADEFSGGKTSKDYKSLSAENELLDTRDELPAKVFPNPVGSIITVDGVLPGSDIVIVDVQGRMVETHNSKEGSATIEVGNLVRGIYFIRFVQPDGSQSTQRIIKK